MLKELLFVSLCLFALSSLIDGAPQNPPPKLTAPDMELMETAETKFKGGGGGGGGKCCGGGHRGGGGGHYHGGGGHGGGGGGFKGGKGFKKG